MSTEEIGLWAGFVFTLMVFSYVLGDNFLYRLAVYVFVGLAAGYIAIVTVESVLIPWFDGTVGSGDAGSATVGIVPVVLFILLMFKTSTRLARFGNLGIAFIIGVGAAVAIVGALTGTLIPLARDTSDAGKGLEGEDLIDPIILVGGVVSSLVYFQYLARRRPNGQIERGRAVQAVGLVGQGFVVVTLGALYAAAILTSLTIFTERISFLLIQIKGG